MEDSQIIDLYFLRSEQAIAETKAKYSRLLMHIAMNILGNPADAEECENDTYMSAWNAIPPTRPNVFSAFLSRINRNLALNRYEYNRAKKRDQGMELVLSELEECIADKKSVEQSVEEGVLVEIIEEFLDGLKQEQRIIFVRRYWYSDPVKEIAGRMRISESKVKTTLFRTRNALSEYLGERGITI